MNRKILFRGKSLSNREWVYGFYTQGIFINPNTGKETIRHIIDNELLHDVDIDTVGQFTGMTDKNGVKIFESDIVECVSWNEYFSKDGQPMEPFRRKMYVDFRRGGFKMVEPMPEPMKDNEWDIIYNGDIVIIGNIYDNPELLSIK